MVDIVEGFSMAYDMNHWKARRPNGCQVSECCTLLAALTRGENGWFCKKDVEVSYLKR